MKMEWRRSFGRIGFSAEFFLLLSHLAIAPSQASAAIVPMEQSTANWRLVDYGNGNIDVFGSGASCPDGHMTILGSSFSIDTINRFWSAVATAMASGKIIGVEYDNSSGCFIQHFWIR